MRLKKKKKGSQRYDINCRRPRHGHKHNVLSNTYATFEAQLIKKLSNTDAGFKKKRVYFNRIS